MTPIQVPADVASALDPAARLLAKAHAVAAEVARLDADVDGAHALAHAAEVREALTRSELTLALHASLSQRAKLRVQLGVAALAAYRSRAIARPRRHNRLSQRLDRILSRLGSLGQALVIARSGLWQEPGSEGFRSLVHYVRRGPDPKAEPRAFIDQAWYLTQYPDVATGRLAPLTHYLLRGGREGRAPGPLFHEVTYRAAHAAALAATSLTGLEHYVRVGATEGSSPHPLFDVAHYLSQGPVLQPDEAPLAHYLREGARVGLSPHPLFDPVWYAADTAANQGLGHYLTVGWREGRSPHPLFDGAAYLQNNPDVAAMQIDPLTHFVVIGGLEGRSPGPGFDLAHYVAQRGADLAPGVNPLIDYLQGGAWDVADARPGFPNAAYIAHSLDLVVSGITPLEHWARHLRR